MVELDQNNLNFSQENKEESNKNLTGTPEINSLSDTISDKADLLQETSSINKLDEPTMEVHKHPHHVTHKKKWPEYLLEFFMIFFAVFMGFIAENIREQSADHKREIEYINSLINDLKTDTTKINKDYVEFERNDLMHDTLIAIFPFLLDNTSDVLVDNKKTKFKQFYTQLKSESGGFPDFIYTDATIQQLKNSGGFRLLTSRETIDSIMAYDAIVKEVLIYQNQLQVFQNDLDKYDQEIFNFREMTDDSTFKPDWLLTHDKMILIKYDNKVISYYSLYENTKDELIKLKLEAKTLLTYLSQKYQR
jgi:hypothetical protein